MFRPGSRTEFPWIVSIKRGNDHVCSGSVVTSRHVLTSAACLISVPRDQLRVTILEHDLTQHEETDCINRNSHLSSAQNKIFKNQLQSAAVLSYPKHLFLNQWSYFYNLLRRESSILECLISFFILCSSLDSIILLHITLLSWSLIRDSSSTHQDCLQYVGTMMIHQLMILQSTLHGEPHSLDHQ